MKLAVALTRFLDQARLSDSTSTNPQPALTLLNEYFSADAALAELTRASLRDLLSQWYVEKACRSTQADTRSIERGGFPAPLDLVDSIEEFVSWTDKQDSTDQLTELKPVLNEMRHSLPRALRITDALTKAVQSRGGAF